MIEDIKLIIKIALLTLYIILAVGGTFYLISIPFVHPELNDKQLVYLYWKQYLIVLTFQIVPIIIYWAKGKGE